MTNLLSIFLLLGAADPQLVRLNGTVLLTDGQSAANATVIGACWHSPTVRAQTDRDGKFTLTSEFAGPVNITAMTADGKFAGKLWVAAQSIRRRAAESLTLKLAPTRQINILVKKDGKPAANVQVGYTKELPPQRTDGNGLTSFSIPADETGLRFSAWLPAYGVGGASVETKKRSSKTQTIEIDLQPSSPATFSVFDESDQPAVGVKLSTNCRLLNAAWFIGDQFPDSHGATDANGKLNVPWVPAKREYAYAEPTNPDWKNDGADVNPKDANPGKLHVRRSHRMKGRVVMPEGVSPENLLVQARSYGSRSQGTSSGARVRPDGKFEISVVSEHFFTLGIVDEEWTSPRHSAVLFAKDESPKEKTFKAEKTTPLEIRVVAGKDKKPIANAYLQGGEDTVREWRYPSGEKRRYFAELRQFGYTDEQGVVRFGLSREPVSFSAFHGGWRDEIKAKPPSSGPFQITFHKPFVDVMCVAGKITPAPAVPRRIELRWANGEYGDDKSTAVSVSDDGSFSFETTTPKVRLFATDRIAKASATALVAMESDRVEMRLIPDGTYGGVVNNPDGDPIPHCEVTLFLNSARALFSRTVEADAKGKFLVENVPTETKLSVRLKPPGFNTRYYEHGEAYLEPGERYLDAVDVCSELPAAKPKPERSITQALAINERDSRLWHAPALVVASGPGTGSTDFLKRLAGDEAYTEAEWKYCFPIKITAERLVADAGGKAEFAKRAWPVPAAGEVVLAAMSGEGKSLGHVVLKASDIEAVKKGTAFLVKHAPHESSAITAVETALAEAKKTKRNVFFQTGELRCGPCYLFARWIDQHHAELDKHFVFIKLSNLHSNWEAVIDRYQLKPSGGIPWTAILDADGKVLVTGDGPTGNIGFPTDGVGKKHFRRMLEAGAKRMTPAERDALLATLPRS